MTFDLDHWSALERRYDGPIPPEYATEAAFSLCHADRLERAQGLRLMWASALRRQIRRIRKARQIAGAQPHCQALERELQALRLYARSANRECWRLLRKIGQ
ncbi:MAG TPA: hypothetical protein VM661_17095 [Candidatus Sulfotelmatobacter sp.]|jgi:hypothetical protein|nr:hypothetical protein [Candidatus Sulfotelmatobacter sp.]